MTEKDHGCDNHRNIENNIELDIKRNVDYLQQLPEPLLDWYHENKRSLPWREQVSPYRVWISEIMLQQTRVEAGKAYFLRFVKRLPDVSALANVADEELMKLWEGLGYYSRARNLKKAAGVVMEQYGGSLPPSYEELLRLPGVGPYTAGAVSSIAYGISVPAVDGNVLRVISRILEQWDDIAQPWVKKTMERELSQVIPQDRPGDFNQALMELGAIVCVPKGAPRCGECPAASFCRGRLSNTAEELPVKAAKKARRIEEKTVVILLDQQGRMALRKRPEKGLLSGLWELPSFPGELTAAETAEQLTELGLNREDILELSEAGAAKHIFSHIEWRMTGYLVRLAKSWEDQETEIPDRYVKDVELRRQKEAEAEEGRLVFADSGELSGYYTMPSAFKGFREFFPR